MMVITRAYNGGDSLQNSNLRSLRCAIYGLRNSEKPQIKCRGITTSRERNAAGFSMSSSARERCSAPPWQGKTAKQSHPLARTNCKLWLKLSKRPTVYHQWFKISKGSIRSEGKLYLWPHLILRPHHLGRGPPLDRSQVDRGAGGRSSGRLDSVRP